MPKKPQARNTRSDEDRRRADGFRERLKELIREHEGSVRQLAIRAGVGERAVNRIVGEDKQRVRYPTLPIVQKLVEHYRGHGWWLLTGRPSVDEAQYDADVERAAARRTIELLQSLTEVARDTVPPEPQPTRARSTDLRRSVTTSALRQRAQHMRERDS